MSEHHKETDKGSALMQKILLGAITSLISISLTFAATEHALCAGVREDNIRTKSEIQSIKEVHEHITTLLETIVRQNTELITLIKVQQQIKGP